MEEKKEKELQKAKEILNQLEKDISILEIQYLEKCHEDIVKYLSKLSGVKRKDVDYILKIFLLEILSEFHKNNENVSLVLPFIGKFEFKLQDNKYTLQKYELSEFISANNKKLDETLEFFLFKE